jgi:hypothetical protein
MDEQRKYAILFASRILCARKLIETMRTLAAAPVCKAKSA